MTKDDYEDVREEFRKRIAKIWGIEKTYENYRPEKDIIDFFDVWLKKHREVFNLMNERDRKHEWVQDQISRIYVQQNNPKVVQKLKEELIEFLEKEKAQK